MKLLFENWRQYQKEVEKETIVLNEERLNEIFGMPQGAVSLSDPEMGTTKNIRKKQMKHGIICNSTRVKYMPQLRNKK